MAEDPVQQTLPVQFSAQLTELGRHLRSVNEVSFDCFKLPVESSMHLWVSIPFVPSFFLNVTRRKQVMQATYSDGTLSSETSLKFFQTLDVPV